MECPRCNLISPPGAVWCDCGYAFGWVDGESLRPTYKSEEVLRAEHRAYGGAVARAGMWSLVGGLLGIFLGLIFLSTFGVVSPRIMAAYFIGNTLAVVGGIIATCKG